ncbi:MAG: hypothetical protein R3324_06395 [Halobacteriales archaeon]|nr:hypothetical protein [Halobacteriales archaeon]
MSKKNTDESVDRAVDEAMSKVPVDTAPKAGQVVVSPDELLRELVEMGHAVIAELAFTRVSNRHLARRLAELEGANEEATD